jgi:predicted flap endonuclease-1-like 5' DNA nuclease
MAVNFDLWAAIMKDKKSSNFLIGLGFGVLVAVLIWYWQKSTSAENGALTLLDRLAAAEARIRELGAELAVTVTNRDQEESWTPTGLSAGAKDEPVDLETVRGIGPIFAARLRQARIDTLEKLAAASAERVAEILNIGDSRAEAILMEARSMLGR